MQSWKNVTRKEPCPICHKPDWCSVSTDGVVCVCRRVPSPYPTKSGTGWIHRLKENFTGDATKVASPYGTNRFASCGDAALAASQRQAVQALWSRLPEDATATATLARQLGVSAVALAALGMRYDAFLEAYAFPMLAADGSVNGIRYRGPDGRKWSALGSHDGLFFADTESLQMPFTPVFGGHGVTALPLSAGRASRPATAVDLVVCEGTSDTAAALSMGLAAVGRSSCMTGSTPIRALLRLRRLTRVTIVTDNDDPGRRGAFALGDALGCSYRVVFPPIGYKDLRAWYNHADPATARATFDTLASAARWRLARG